MATSDLAKYVVRLEAQTAQYQQSLANANNKLESFHRSQTRIVGSIKSAFVALGGLYAINSAARFIKSQVETVDAIGEVADQAGIGAEQLQRLEFAFQSLTQATKGQINQGLQTFNKNLGEARGGSEKLQKAFARMGVDITSTTDVALEQAFSGLAKYSDGAKRAADASDAFGVRVGPKFAGALKDGTVALEKMRAAATGVFTDEQVKKASDLNDQFEKLQGIMTKEFASAVLENAGAWETMANAMALVVGLSGSILTFLNNVGKGLANVPFEGKTFGSAFAKPSHEFSGVIQGRGPPPPSIEQPAAALSAAKKTADDLAQYNEDLVKSRIETEQRAADNLAEYNAGVIATRAANEERVFEETNKKRVEEEEALTQMLGEQDLQRFQKMNDQAEAFGELFADNLIQAADGGFDAVLKSWILTLEQMVLKAAAIQLFKGLAGSGGWVGTAFGAVAGMYGGARAEGGPVSPGRAFLVGERGPELFMPSSSGSIVPNGGGVVINQNVTVGAGASRAEVAAAMRVAKNAAQAELIDKKRRGQ